MSYIKHKTMLDSVNDPRNVEVFTNDRFLSKDAGRLISRKSLLNSVSIGCKYYRENSCNICETEKEVHCLAAWQLTIGKGKKLY